jgi:hypothetical protein
MGSRKLDEMAETLVEASSAANSTTEDDEVTTKTLPLDHAVYC